MFDKLKLLKMHGYVPDAVFDIGAYHGNWTRSMKQIYDNSEYFLFEAIDYNELKSFTNVFNVVLSDKNEYRDWYEMKNTGDSLLGKRQSGLVTVKLKNVKLLLWIQL